MIPAAFDYARASSADEAMSLLAEHGDDAKLLAGGHSLLPLMKLRLAQPAMLIDVGRIAELRGIRDAGDHVAIGALTRHREVETSDLLQAAGADPARGHAPRSAIPRSATAARSAARSPTPTPRRICPRCCWPSAAVSSPAPRLAASGSSPPPTSSPGSSSQRSSPTSCVTEIRVPKVPGAGWSFQKFNRRAQDWAIVGVAAVRNGTTGIGLVNMGSTPLRATAVEQALAQGASNADAAQQAAVGAEPQADINASVEFRTHLAQVLVRRALEEASG